ncbi:MAG: hypothetical protein CM15mP45_04240 [Deltaproteobacteria bacterium]|nr:MAG: hypothetical protein CM15mP45_04240 [Deltaproteobacteria bacterium]
MSVLQVNDLHASYSSSGSEILKGISFDVAENDFVAIIGPSGAGKSTLIRCINRLVEPSSGSDNFQVKILLICLKVNYEELEEILE